MKHRAPEDPSVRIIKEFYAKTKYQLGEMALGIGIIATDAGLPESARSSTSALILGVGGCALTIHGMRNANREIASLQTPLEQPNPTDEL